MRPVERAAYLIGALLMLSGVIHLAILLIGGGTWEGPVSLRKATTFGISFGLTLVNVTLVTSFLPLKDRTRTLLLGVFATACVLETFLVSLQAWRGVPSHFNVETPFDAAIAQALALGGFILVTVVVVLTVAAFRAGTALPPGLRLALRAGFVALVGAQIVGGLMIATGMRLVFSGDPQTAYATGGWLKPVHAALMHGILVLPLGAWLISRTGWDERNQARALRAVLAIYALVVAAAVIVSALGIVWSDSILPVPGPGPWPPAPDQAARVHHPQQALFLTVGAAGVEPHPHPDPPVDFAFASCAQQPSVPAGAGPPQHPSGVASFRVRDARSASRVEVCV